jgi:hypothetical protein
LYIGRFSLNVQFLKSSGLTGGLFPPVFFMDFSNLAGQKPLLTKDRNEKITYRNFNKPLYKRPL